MAYSMIRVKKRIPGKLHLAKTSKFAGVLLLLFAPLIALPPLIRDHEFLMAAKRSDGQQLILITESWPKDSKRFLLTASGLTSGGYDVLAKEVILKGLDHNPNSLFLWKALNANKLSTPSEIEHSKSEIKRLDPRSIPKS